MPDGRSTGAEPNDISVRDDASHRKTDYRCRLRRTTSLAQAAPQDVAGDGERERAREEQVLQFCAELVSPGSRDTGASTPR